MAWFCLLLLFLFGNGCERTTALAPSASAAAQVHLDHAQPKLPTVKLWIGPKAMLAEVARTPTQIATGMMFRKEMAADDGMIFVFAQPHRASFCMRNTIIPLSCAYIDSEGVILEIHDLKPKDETPVLASSDNVRYVLETNQGWFEKNQIKPGTVIATENGSLTQVFFGKR
jgi:uncharacterized membrane protein (UPF0127 family)